MWRPLAGCVCVLLIGGVSRADSAGQPGVRPVEGSQEESFADGSIGRAPTAAYLNGALPDCGAKRA